MFGNTLEISTRELLDILRRMAQLAEYREGNFLHHLDRIRRYCFLLGTGLKLSKDEVEIISIASQLHDIGKVRNPEALLNRSDDFSAIEWEIIESHTVIGASLLRGSTSSVINMGEQIVLSHHERWDGSGYPRGLEGENIPVGGRICALADVFDALTTKRPYKEESSVEEAKLLINEASGVLFDPEIVRVFNEKFEDFVKIKDEFPD